MLSLFCNNIILLVNILLSHGNKEIVIIFILQEHEFCDEKNKIIYLSEFGYKIPRLQKSDISFPENVCRCISINYL